MHATTVWDPDGPGPQPPLLAVGGTFSKAGQTPASAIALWDGSSWHSPGSGFDIQATVYALTVFNGELVAAGLFSTAGGQSAGSVARWDGSTWRTFGSGIGPGIVYTLTVYNGDLIAAGSFFDTGDGLRVNHIARWDGSAWHAMGTGSNGNVIALTVHNGELIAGGYFSKMGGLTVNRIARWNGTSWQTLGTGMAGQPVQALGMYQGDLIAGGSFTTAGGAEANRIARWNGTTWQPLGSGMDSRVSELTVYNGELIAGGTFMTADGVRVSRIARWDGISWKSLAGGLSDSGGTARSVYALAVFNGDLIVGGSFSAISGLGVSHVARWNGQAWGQLGVGLNHSVLAMAPYEGGLVAGGALPGTFGHGSDWVGPGLAHWDGGSLRSLGSGLNSSVFALVVHDGHLIAGGSFGAAGAVTTGPIARWDGASWQPLGDRFQGGTTPTVHALAIYNGELIAGGNFTHAGATPVTGISRWDGSSWQSLGTGLGSGVGSTPVVYTLAVYNGLLIAGGVFSNAGGVSALRIAAWDGAAWYPLGTGISSASGVGIGAWVAALTTYDGELVAGGGFGTAGGTPVNNLARWDGAAWHPMGTGTNSAVAALTTYNDELIVGGSFTAAGGVAARYIAGWDGVSWRSLGTGIVNGSVTLVNGVLALTNYDGELLAGGVFTTAGDLPAKGLARWGPSIGPSILTSPSPASICRAGSATFSTTAEGTWPLSYQWRRAGVNLNNGTTNSGSVIAGATTGTLHIYNAAAGDDGPYDCIVTNPCNTATSAAAALTVCYADYTCDGFTDGLDYDLFTADFESANPAADINGDGFTDGIDYDLFNNQYEDGC